MQPSKTSPYFTAARLRLYSYILLVFIVLIYLANAFAPLHLHVDSIRYYNIKDCLEFGCNPNSFAGTDYLPYGYTALLITLSKLGVLSAVSIVLINCFFLFTGMYFLQKLLKPFVSTFLVLLITLFNWTVIKFCAHPLSEMQYIFFSFASLYSFHLFITRKNYLYLLAAFVLCICTILTRTIGIALLPALMLGIVWQHRTGIKDLILKNKIIVLFAIVLLSLLLFFAKQFKILDYTNNLKAPFQKGIFHFFTENLKFHFTEITEVFFNAPYKKAADMLPTGVASLLYITIGLFLFCWLVYAIVMKRNKLPFYLKAYLFFYILIIINWPYYDPRFWVPLIPIIAAVYLQTPFNLYTLLRIPYRISVVIYLLIGISAATYYLWMGMDHHRFSSRQASGVYRNEYETYFFGQPQSDTAKKIDQNVLEILKKYD